MVIRTDHNIDLKIWLSSGRCVSLHSAGTSTQPIQLISGDTFTFSGGLRLEHAGALVIASGREREPLREVYSLRLYRVFLALDRLFRWIRLRRWFMPAGPERS